MRLKLYVFAAVVALFLAGTAALTGQQNKDIVATIIEGQMPKIAVIEFHGTGDAQTQMGTFNTTLLSELQGSGRLDIVNKSLYPIRGIPQQPSDFTSPVPPAANMKEWSNPPVGANYLAFGYTAVQNGRLVLFGSATVQEIQNGTAAGVLSCVPSGAGNPASENQHAGWIIQG